MAQGPQGALHAAYVNLDGVLTVASCKTNCQQASSWQRVNVAQDKYGDNVARIKVDSKGTVHVMRLMGEHLSTMVASYSVCAANCTAAKNWSTVRLPNEYAVADDQLDNDWFALDRQGRPRFMLSNGYYIFGNEQDTFLQEQVVYTYCDQNCQSAGNWKAAPLTDIGMFGNSSGTLQFDAQNRAHWVGGPESQLSYMTCAEKCGDPRQWSPKAAIAELGEYSHTERAYDLTVAPDGTLYVPFTFENEPGKDAQLWLYSCAEACTSPGAWKKVNLSQHAAFPKNLRDAGMQPVSNYFGGKLTIAFNASHTSAPAQRLYTMTCAGSCSSAQGQWSAELAYSTEKVVFPDRGVYRYMYTTIQPQNLLGGGQVALLAVPYWGVLYEDWVPGTDPVSNSDFQWMPIPTLVW